jgi:hypothetical protein
MSGKHGLSSRPALVRCLLYLWAFQKLVFRQKYMNKVGILHFGLRKWIFSLILGVVAFGLSMESAQAGRQRIVLPDGVEAFFDMVELEAVITLSGTSKNSYQIEASEDLVTWVVVRNRALLDNNGTFTYVDTRGLPKCFYRIKINKEGTP